MDKLTEIEPEPVDSIPAGPGIPRVAVVGAATAFGREMFRSLSQWEKIELAVAIDPHEVGKNMRELVGGRAANVVVEEKVGAALDRERCDILVDFGHSASCLQHAISAMKRGVAPIIGGTKIVGPDLRELIAASQEFSIPALVVPYFSVGAVLMMQFCDQASRWLTDVEIVDVQPDNRNTQCSFLARAFAESVADGWEHRQLHPHSWVDPENTRTWHDVPLHIPRIKGSAPYQQILFGGPGESISVRFDWNDPVAIVDGLKLAIESVRSLTGVTVGLEKVMFKQGKR